MDGDDRPILVVDFDGVLHSYESAWQGARVVADGPVPGAMAFLRDAIENFAVCVVSSRSGQPGGIDAMQDALRAWLTAEYGEDEAYDILEAVGFPDAKPPAFLTLDDRAITFDGTFPDPSSLLAFRPWNKR